MTRSDFSLPENPTSEDIIYLEQYLKAAKKKLSATEYGTKNFYSTRHELMGNKLIIYQPSDKKHNNFYMRFYVGNSKYKRLSLGTSDETVAREKAFEKWRQLSNQLETGGAIFEKSAVDNLKEYMQYLEGLYKTDQLKYKTIATKRTSLKKLMLRLEIYNKLSEVPANFLNDYPTWRRTKNWDKTKHINNPKPPSNLTINTELKDFKGFFTWCHKNKKFMKDIEYPFMKIDYKKFVEKNPSFTDGDWNSVVMYLRTWRNKKTTSTGKKRKNNFYRLVFAEFIKILANSGMRVHECLLLTWGDITLRKRYEIIKKTGKKVERVSAIIQIHPDTKTGRRKVICPAGIYLKRLKQLYQKTEDRMPKNDEFVFRNIGCKNSKNAHIGGALSDSFMRRMWYEFLEDIKNDKDIEFEERYTLHSMRAYYINKRLEFGISPSFVAKLVGHNIRTMEKHYENIQLLNLEPELIKVRKDNLEKNDIQTFDIDML